MSKKRLSAQPIREGVAEISGTISILWCDYCWNTGTIVRDWHVDPDSVGDLEVEERPIERQKGNGETS